MRETTGVLSSTAQVFRLINYIEIANVVPLYPV